MNFEPNTRKMCFRSIERKKRCKALKSQIKEITAEVRESAFAKSTLCRSYSLQQPLSLHIYRCMGSGLPEPDFLCQLIYADPQPPADHRQRFDLNSPLSGLLFFPFTLPYSVTQVWQTYSLRMAVKIFYLTALPPFCIISRSEGEGVPCLKKILCCSA